MVVATVWVVFVTPAVVFISGSGYSGGSASVVTWRLAIVRVTLRGTSTFVLVSPWFLCVEPAVSY